MTPSQPQTPTANASKHYDAGRAYLSDIAEAAVAIVVGDFDLAAGHRADAAEGLRPLDRWDANQLRDFVAGINCAAEEYLECAHHQRPALVLIGDDYALHIPDA